MSLNPTYNYSGAKPMKSLLCGLASKFPLFFSQHLNAAQVQTGRLVSVVTRSVGGVPLMKSAGGNNNRGGGGWWLRRRDPVLPVMPRLEAVRLNVSTASRPT